MPRRDKYASHRYMLFLDITVGIILSTIALVGIFVLTITYDIANLTGWLTGLIFWIFYLSLTSVLMFIGLYTRHQEKHYREREPRKDLKAPIVS